MTFKVAITLKPWFSFRNKQSCRWWELKDETTIGHSLPYITEIYPEIEFVTLHPTDWKVVFTLHFESDAHYSWWLLKLVDNPVC